MPLCLVWVRLFGTRRLIARDLEVDDLPSRGRLLASDRVDEILDVMVERRDRPLVDALTAIHEERSREQIQVGVVYGAGHVAAVISALHALGYRHRGAEWLTVFTVDS